MLSDNLSDIFSEDCLNEIAKETGFVKRSSTITGANFLELLLSNSAQGTSLSLEDLASRFESTFGKQISKQGLDERFNENTVIFLKKVLKQLLEKELTMALPGNKEPQFKSCRLRDSTRFGLPNEFKSVYKGHGGATKSESMISIQYEFDLLSGNHIDLQLTSGCRNDQKDTLESITNIREGELLIRDLGYVTSGYIREVVDANAFFLNRLPSQMSIYDQNGEKIKFDTLFNKLKKNGLPYLELPILLGKKAQTPCRLVVSICEDDAVKKRLKKTTKNTQSTGHKVSQETKDRAKLNMYITNAPESKIMAQSIYQIYTLRWQIELIFKVWKSIVKINQVKKVKLHRFESILLAGLIWVLANWRLFQVVDKWLKIDRKNKKSLSIWKFYKFTSHYLSSFINLIKAQISIEEWLSTLLGIANSKLIRDVKKGALSHNQRLEALFSS